MCWFLEKEKSHVISVPLRRNCRQCASLRTSAKLKFYTNCKEEFGREPYLQLKDQKLRQSLSRTRLSAHFLGIETGRYNKAEGLFARKCDLCSPDVDDLRHLPFFDPVIEDEWHFLVSCPANHDLRSRLPEETLSRLLQGAAGCDIKELFKTAKDSRPLAIYLANTFKRRKLAKEEPPSPTWRPKDTTNIHRTTQLQPTNQSTTDSTVCRQWP